MMSLVLHFQSHFPLHTHLPLMETQLVSYLVIQWVTHLEMMSLGLHFQHCSMQSLMQSQTHCAQSLAHPIPTKPHWALQMAHCLVHHSADCLVGHWALWLEMHLALQMAQWLAVDLTQLVIQWVTHLEMM
jgi:hypothetical protein